MSTPTPTTRPAIQVVVPGPLTTDMRTVEGVRVAKEQAAAALETPVAGIYLAAVETDPDSRQVVYTFGVR